MKKLSILTILLVFGQSALWAQEHSNNKEENSFSLSGQIRPRFELRSGTFQPIQDGQNMAALASDRIRLQTDYQYRDLVKTRISIQSVGVWGQGNMVQAVENGGNKLAIFEAWADIKLAERWNMKFGRQVISLDDERFFGALDWAQGGRTHDALSVQYTDAKFQMKSYFAFNQNYRSTYNNNISNPYGNLYNTSGAFPYKSMQTIWAQRSFGDAHKVSALFTNLGFQNASSAADSSKTQFLQTLGANYFYNKNKWSGNVSGYYQFGKSTSAIKTNAMLLAAAINYNVTQHWNLGLGVDYLSGNDIGTANTSNKAFNPFFGTNHKFYGTMDYYYAGNGHANVGLMDYYFSLGFKPNTDLALKAAVHAFNSAGDITGYDKSLGQELDLSFDYALNKVVSLNGGYSQYFTSNTLNFLKGTPNPKGMQQWLWLTINVKPKFFSTKF